VTREEREAKVQTKAGLLTADITKKYYVCVETDCQAFEIIVDERAYVGGKKHIDIWGAFRICPKCRCKLEEVPSEDFMAISSQIATPQTATPQTPPLQSEPAKQN
jgi:hypothetical protein